MTARHAFACWFVAILAAGAHAALAESTVWEPHTYVLSATGSRIFEDQAPVEIRDTCGGNAEFLVRITNGTSSSGTLVTGGSVTINGTAIARFESFTSSLRTIDLPFVPAAANTVRVELASGKAGSAVTVAIVKVLESHQLDRTYTLTSKSGVYADTVWALPGAPYVLVVESGSGGALKPTGLSVRVNGVEVVKETDVQKFSIARRALTLGEMNPIEVSMRGTAGATVSISIRYVQPPEGCDPFLVLSLLTPADGAAVAVPLVAVSGTLIGPPEVKLTLDGDPIAFDVTHAGTGADPFPWQGVAYLDEGENTVVVTAIVGGATPPLSRQVLVTYDRAAEPVDLQAVPSSGTPPLTVSYQLADSLSEDVFIVELDLDGDGTYESEHPSVPDTLSWTFDTPGEFTPSVRITRNGGAVVTAETTVSVDSFAIVDAVIRARWGQFTSSLAEGDIEGALLLVDGDDTRAKYRRALSEISTELPVIAATPIRAVSIQGAVATYLALRTIAGEQRGFWVTFLRGADGVWRIAQF